jgi:hypothetical protein
MASNGTTGFNPYWIISLSPVNEPKRREVFHPVLLFFFN